MVAGMKNNTSPAADSGTELLLEGHHPLGLLGPRLAPRQVANPRLKLSALLLVGLAVIDPATVLAFLGAFSVVALPTGFPSDFLLGSHEMRCDLTAS